MFNCKSITSILYRFIVLGTLYSRHLLMAIESEILYLTWVDDPTTTMTIVWQSVESSEVLFHLDGKSNWISTKADPHPMSNGSIKTYIAHIKKLKPNSTYTFKIEGSEREYQFRTLPEQLSRDVRFVIGGDIFYQGRDEVFERMNRVICSADPDFVVLGGDIAYTTGSKQSTHQGAGWEFQRWQEFLQKLQKTLYGQGGRLIPIMPVVGNHDVHSMVAKNKDPELFYQIFPFPVEGQAYRMMQAGHYLGFIFLDSGHTWPIDQEQMEWLKDQLRQCDTSYLFAAYHIGAYPSVPKHKSSIPALIRKTWVPLFESTGLSAAFEHHSHALKRTYRLRDNQKDPTGVIYLGDGSWGAPPRQVYTKQQKWYLEKASSVNACWFVRLSHEIAEVEARTADGEVVDYFTIPCRVGLMSP